MSSYSASRVTITLAGRILQKINASGCTFFDLTRPVIGSADLAAHAESLDNIKSLGDLQQWWAGLEAEAGALSTLEQAQALNFGDVHQVLDGSDGAPDLQQTVSHLSASLDTTVDLLRADERELTAVALDSALTDLGYTVTRSEGEHVNSIAAYKADHVFAALISDGGVTEIDTAGLSGDSCAEPLATLDATLRARGIQLQIERRVDHGDSNGGTLIQRAAIANATDLAAGLIAAAEGGKRATSKPKIMRRRIQAVGGTA